MDSTAGSLPPVPIMRLTLLYKRKEEERTGVVLYPEPKDVLIGRGRPYHEYAGTRQLLELIESELERYYHYDNNSDNQDATTAVKTSNDRFWKTCINIEIVKKIQELGGRFLQRSTKLGGWKILDEITAREKTANLFRYRYNLLGKSTTAATQSTMGGSNSLVNTKKRLRDDFLLSGGGGAGRSSLLDDEIVMPSNIALLRFQ